MFVKQHFIITHSIIIILRKVSFDTNVSFSEQVNVMYAYIRKLSKLEFLMTILWSNALHKLGENTNG